ncbi:MAG: hypothetical protein ABI883_08700, partial [Chthoniobacterales bacterium]
ASRNLPEIAQQLGVAHLLEGSVQRAGNRVRVNAQLIATHTGVHEWAETYDRDLADVFAIQSEIAATIARQLQATISPREKAAMAAAPTTDLLANELYVQANALGVDDRPQRMLEGVRLLDQAIARDPQFVLACCLLGRLHVSLFYGGYDHTPARLELAKAALEKARRLQPESGEVQLGWARYAYYGFRDFDRARAELDLARGTLPNDAEIYYLSALLDRRQGRWAEATRNAERAVELDPGNLDHLLVAVGIYEGLRRYSEASRLCDRAAGILPHNRKARLVRAEIPFIERADLRPLRSEISAILAEEPGARAELAVDVFDCAMIERDSAAVVRALAAIPAEGVQGGAIICPREWFAGLAARASDDPAAALAAFTAARAIVEKLVLTQPDYAQAWSLLGRIDAGLGRTEEGAREGRRACELLPVSADAVEGSELVGNLAAIYAWIGEKDLALEQLALSAQMPMGVYYGSLKLDPDWDSLRGDPRFEKIVASLGPKGVQPNE